MASGLLIILINKATKLSDDFMGLSKEYIADIKFGTQTDTMDMDGTITRSTPVKELDESRIKEILEGFTGIQEQVPPMYSALKHEGQPLYRLARQGVEVDRKARKTNIYGIDVLGWDKDQLKVKVSCSSGTYIRVLAHDIGNAYGTGAALSGLRRTMIGNMDVGGATGIKNLEKLTDGKKALSGYSWMVSLEELVKDSINLCVSSKYVEQVKNGSRLSRSMLEGILPERDKPKGEKGLFADMAAVKTKKGKLLAIHRILTGYDKINALNINKVFTKSVVIF
jgi:tRNA pseudouridine55 synthase